MTEMTDEELLRWKEKLLSEVSKTPLYRWMLAGNTIESFVPPPVKAPLLEVPQGDSSGVICKDGLCDTRSDNHPSEGDDGGRTKAHSCSCGAIGCACVANGGCAGEAQDTGGVDEVG